MRVPFAAICALALSGCTAASPDYHVRIDTPGMGYGHGILIGPSTVVTVEHVAPVTSVTYKVSRASRHKNGQRPIRYVKAERVRRFGGSSAEPLVVLRLKTPMACTEYPEFRNVEPGDSGSPILGKRGEVIGLVSGMKRRFFFVERPVFSWAIIGTNGPIGPVPGAK